MNLSWLSLSYFKIDVYLLRESRGNSAGGNDVRRIGDVILRNFDTVTTEYYMKYVDAHNLILEKLEDALNKNVRFSQVYPNG